MLIEQTFVQQICITEQVSYEANFTLQTCINAQKGTRFLNFLDFQSLTTVFGLGKEFSDQNRNGVFFYFHVFLCGNEFFWPKQLKKKLIGADIFFSEWVAFFVKRSGI
jgi:hypothetical protein